MIEIVEYGKANWIDTFCDYLIKNQPCILSDGFTEGWPARKEWALPDGKPNYEHLKKEYGECVVPVLSEDSCTYENMKLSAYIDAVQDENNHNKAYVKDWHFQSSTMKQMVYDLPLFLQFDWVNQEAWTSDPTNIFGGDYRFVYIGAKGTWTKFHCDVMNTYSWSANICGRKLWYLMKPSSEKFFMIRDQLHEDIRDHRDKWASAGVIEFVQEPGQIVFVPSMWHHQEDAISINHNFINACNVDYIIELMRTRLGDVIRGIEDVRPILSKDEFDEKCQLILNADIRINFEKLRTFLNMVIDDRTEDAYECWFCYKHKSIFECKKDDECIERMRSSLKGSCKCNKLSSLCDDCTKFNKSFEITCATHAVRLLDEMTHNHIP